MARASVGTLDWAARTRGRLRWSDRARLLVEALLTRINAARKRGDRAPFDVDVDALPIPDSAVSRSADAHLRASSEPWLANHCLRTYLWGAIVGMGEKRRFDAEILYVAALFHDLGLTDRAAGYPSGCFAVAGALAAEDLLVSSGERDGERRRRIAEAIALHLNVRVSPAQGIEAYLLHEGAALDVTGLRYEDLSPSSVSAVVARHPRLQMKESISAAMKEQWRVRPHSRAAFLCRVGFIGMIRRAPFAS